MPGLCDKAAELCQNIDIILANANEMTMSQASTRLGTPSLIKQPDQSLVEEQGAAADAAPSPEMSSPVQPQRLLFSGGSADASAQRGGSSSPLLGDSLDLRDSPARAAEDLVKYHGRRAEEEMNQLLAYVQKIEAAAGEKAEAAAAAAEAATSMHLREMNAAVLMHRRLMIAAAMVILALLAILGAIVVYN